MTSGIESHPIPPEQQNKIVLASGGVNPDLATSVAESIGIKVADVQLKRHPNGELYVRYSDSIRGKDVFALQSQASGNGYTVEEAINEHLYLVNAAAGASARSVTAIAPYLGHSRGDRKAKGREVVPAPLLIKFYEAAGATAMMSIDLHSQQTAEHFRGGSYEHLTAQPELRQAVQSFLGKSISKCVIVAPDAGAVKNNNRHAEELSADTGCDVDVIFIGKERVKDGSSKITRGSRPVEGVDEKICLTFDDMIDGGNTVASAAELLKNSGAEAVYVAATHPIFSGRALEVLMDSAIDKVFVTDTLPIGYAAEAMGDRLSVVKVGPLIGRAIYEIVTSGSISKLFHDQNHR